MNLKINNDKKSFSSPATEKEFSTASKVDRSRCDEYDAKFFKIEKKCRGRKAGSRKGAVSMNPPGRDILNRGRIILSTSNINISRI